MYIYIISTLVWQLCTATSTCMIHVVEPFVIYWSYQWFRFFSLNRALTQSDPKGWVSSFVLQAWHSKCGSTAQDSWQEKLKDFQNGSPFYRWHTKPRSGLIRVDSVKTQLLTHQSRLWSRSIRIKSNPHTYVGWKTRFQFSSVTFVGVSTWTRLDPERVNSMCVHMHVCVDVFLYVSMYICNITRQEVQPIWIHLHWCVNEHLFLSGSRCNCIDSDCL